jgi:hypothetical protein
MSGPLLGMVLVLTLLAFVAWTGYRVVPVGGTILVLAGAGLLLQPTLSWQFGNEFSTVLGAAVLAIPFGKGRGVAGIYGNGVLTAVVFAVLTFGGSLFAPVEPIARVALLALTLLLVLIAVHQTGENWLMTKAAGPAFLSVRRLWRTGLVIAAAGVVGQAGSSLMPTAELALTLVLFSFADIVAGAMISGFAIVLGRTRPFALAWAQRWSSARRRAIADLTMLIAAMVGTLASLGVASVRTLPAPVGVALLLTGVGGLVAAGNTLVRIRDHVADHRFVAPPSPRSALRRLAASKPVYRLLPGVSREDE